VQFVVVFNREEKGADTSRARQTAEFDCSPPPAAARRYCRFPPPQIQVGLEKSASIDGIADFQNVSRKTASRSKSAPDLIKASSKTVVRGSPTAQDAAT
jgi:hypothetical protein